MKRNKEETKLIKDFDYIIINIIVEEKEKYRLLLARLLAWGYGVTSIDKNDTNIGLVCVNLWNDDNFFEKIIKVVKYINEKVFLYKKSGDNDIFLIRADTSEKINCGKLFSEIGKININVLEDIKNCSMGARQTIGIEAGKLEL